MDKKIFSALIGSFLFSSASYALDATVNGFGSIGYAMSNTDRAAYKYAIADQKNKGYLSDSLVGVQVDANITSKLSLTGQVLVAQSLENRMQMDARTEWLFLGYRIDNATRIRLGRLRIPAYMLSEKLEVGHAYPWARPPVEMYGQMPVSNFDGVDLTYRTDIGDTEVTLQPFFGYSTPNVSGLDQNDPLKAFKVEYNNLAGLNINLSPTDNLKLRLGHLVTDLRATGTPTHQLAPGINTYDYLYGSGTGAMPNDLSRILSFGGSFSSMGMQYKIGNTMIIAELSRRQVATAAFESGTGGYLSLAHKIGSWTPYVYYAQAHGESDKSLKNTVVKAGQSTVAMGINYDLTPMSKIKFQAESTHIDESKGSANGYVVLPYGTTTQNLKGLDIMMYSISYDFLF